jgi:Holliday junction resolvase RusA-like endonuclease
VVRGRFASAYTDKSYRTWQEKAAAQIALIPSEVPFEGPVVVTVDCHVVKPKTSKLTHPRPDVDNYAKSILDALTKDGRFWGDDSQIVSLVINKYWTAATGGFHTITIRPL